MRAGELAGLAVADLHHGQSVAFVMGAVAVARARSEPRPPTHHGGYLRERGRIKPCADGGLTLALLPEMSIRTLPSAGTALLASQS